MAECMVEVVSLTKTFAPSGKNPIEAVKGALFEVHGGEIFGLLGPNGAGKTTLLRMLGTILTPTSGHCVVCGIRSDVDPQGVRRKIGFISGNTRLYKRLTGREVLRYFGRLYGMAEDAIARQTTRFAQLLDMEAFLDRRCDSLSTGQTQKVNIARVMLHDPAVLILDEPTLGLDILTSKTIIDFILDAKTRGRCIVLSTHYMTEAELLCDRIGLIHQGQLLAIDTKEGLCAQTGTHNLKDAFFHIIERAGGVAG